jgi:SAM-dependent methyltransferase
MDPRRILKNLFAAGGAAPSKPALADEFPFSGFTAGVDAPHLQSLGDDELRELNRMLPWKCFIADGKGRRFGAPARLDKRNLPQEIPDSRTPLLDREFHLADKHVLEIGCFEGVHTAGLARIARKVTAVDSRVENVVKTMVRIGFLGVPAAVFKCDIEDPVDRMRLPEADVVHHIGVLYHLKDPVSHLLDLGRITRTGLLLDTHVARPAEATQSYGVGGRVFPYKHYREGGYADPFSGMYEHAKWLTIDTIRALLAEAGLGKFRVAEERDERNGPRVLLFAARR